MSEKKLTPAQANLELIILSSEAEAISSGDFYAWLKDRGLPDEIAIRIKDLADLTTEVGKRVIHVGKMILLRIMDFVKAHPNMAVGIAIGAAVGALSGAIPGIGPYLAAVGIPLGMAVGAVAGHQNDIGQRQHFGYIALAQDVIQIATEFFKLLIDIFKLTLDGQTLRGA